MFGIAVVASMASTYLISSQKIDDIILNKSQVQAEFLAGNASYILENSANYSFNKSHSVSYAALAALEHSGTSP